MRTSHVEGRQRSPSIRQTLLDIRVGLPDLGIASQHRPSTSPSGELAAVKSFSTQIEFTRRNPNASRHTDEDLHRCGWR